MKSFTMFTPGVLNLYSLIYPLATFKSKIFCLSFFIFAILQMSMVVGKRVNFFLTKFSPKAGQIYPRLKTPGLHQIGKNEVKIGNSQTFEMAANSLRCQIESTKM